MEQIKDVILWVQNHKLVAVPLEIIFDIVICFLLYMVAKKLIRIIFNPERKQKDEDAEKRIATLQKISLVAVRTLIIALGAVEILSHFIDVKAILTVAGVGTIEVGIGAQTFISDLISGFVILAENQFYVGDYIEFEGSHYGRVEHIGLRTTRIRQLDDSVFIIRNGEILKLTNFSKGTVRAIVTVGIAFEENIENVYEAVNEMLSQIPRRYPERFKTVPEIMGVDDLDDSAVVLRIEADVKAADKKQAERCLRRCLKETLDEKGIEIPYRKQIILTGTEGKKEIQ